MGTAVLASALEQLRAMVHAKACEELSDRQLLEQFLIQREEAAFVALLQRHGPMVLQVCRRVQGNDHDAEDVLQATFLLLARKAGSIRKPESLASWLHGVAQRLAMKARSQESRRQAIERRAADMRSTGQVSDATWRELQRTLDEALRHVPEKYRLPLVICYLEGKTQEEAARQLRCPLGTVRSRLARGRERLKTVLERRGVCLSAAALTAGLAASAPSATVPPLLIQTTARAAIAFGAGKAAATLVSARAAALVEGGLKIMLTTKIKIVTTVLLTIGTLGLGAGAIATRLMAGSPQATQPTQLGKHQPSSQRPASEPSQESVRLRGRVLDIDGKPMAKANLLLYGTPGKPVDLGSPAADGQFMIEVPEKLKGYFLVARADNAGLDFVNLEKWDRTAPVELRLVADRLIRGRIMGTEGKPAAGVHVQIRNITVYANHALEPFLAERKKRNFNFGLPDGAKYVYFNADSYLETTTDANGQFTFTGVGADRLVGVRVNGASIADEALTILNCDGVEQTKPYTVGTGIMPPKPIGPIRSEPLLYGPDLSVVVEADKPIQGVVTAADTGKPLAGVEVVLPRNADSILGLFLSAKTDAQGRYEIRGARKCKEYEVRVKGDSAAGYLDSSGVATDTPGYQPVTADISVTKGTIISGRVIDKTTGQVVPAIIFIGVLADNPFVKEYSGWNRQEVSENDGTFRIVAIPGPVVLMGAPDSRRLPGGVLESMKYKLAVPDPQYPQYFVRRFGAWHYRTERGGAAFVQGNFCKVIEIKPGTATVHEDIFLEQATNAIRVRIQDAEGHPLNGAWVTGISPKEWTSPIRIEEASCFAYEVAAAKPRLMVFYAPDKNLVGTLRLQGGEKQPVVVKLGPAGSVKGRLVSQEGRPVPGFVIRAAYPALEASEISRRIDGAKQPIVTDAEGAFRIDGLIPGVDFSLYHYPSGSSPQRSTALAEKLSVHPGETRMLGDLRSKPESPE